MGRHAWAFNCRRYSHRDIRTREWRAGVHIHELRHQLESGVFPACSLHRISSIDRVAEIHLRGLSPVPLSPEPTALPSSPNPPCFVCSYARLTAFVHDCRWHAGEHDEYATDVGYAEIAVTALALSIFTAVATETATLVAVSRMEKALISSLGDSNSTRRKAVVWNRDQAYLSLLLAFGLLGTVVVGRATLAMYYVDGAVGRKEVRVSCGIGIMLFVRTAKFVLVVFIVLSLESKVKGEMWTIGVNFA